MCFVNLLNDVLCQGTLIVLENLLRHLSTNTTSKKKQRCSEWYFEGESRLKKARQNQSKIKVLLTVLLQNSSNEYYLSKCYALFMWSSSIKKPYSLACS